MSKKIVFLLFILVETGLLLAGIIGDNFIAGQGWGLLSAEILLAALAFFFWGFEQGRVSSQEIALMAVLGAVASAGRFAFAALPNIQPTTFMVIISGYVFGPRTGFMVGSTAALVSNFFLGQGPWTPWQMLIWGVAGASSGLIKGVYPGIGNGGMVLLNFICGYVYGWTMNLWFWTAFIQPLNWQSLLAVCATSIWFDTMHAVGNAVFCLLFGAGFIRMLKRFQRRMKVVTIDMTEH